MVYGQGHLSGSMIILEVQEKIKSIPWRTATTKQPPPRHTHKKERKLSEEKIFSNIPELRI